MGLSKFVVGMSACCEVMYILANKFIGCFMEYNKIFILNNTIFLYKYGSKTGF